MIEEFFKTSSKLKKVPRSGWKTRLGILEPESVADHTFSMSIIAMVLSDLQNFDTHKVLKMSLLHDLAESIIGDFTPEDIQKDEKNKIENKAITEIFSDLPDELAKEYTIIWREYCENSTNEAILVHEVDKLEMAFQASAYMNEGIKKEKLDPFFTSAKSQINSKYIKDILNKISE